MTTSHLNYCNTLLINISTSRFTFKFSHTAPSAVFLKFRSHEVMVLSKTLPRVTAVCLLVAQLCPTLCNPMDCSLPRSSVHVISQARILEWLAISFSRASSRSKDQTQVSCIAGRCFTVWATREACTVLFIKVRSLEHLWLESPGWHITNTNS